MTKVLFLLSAVVMVLAAFFSYQNHQSFVAARNARIANDKKIGEKIKQLENLSKQIIEVQDNIKKTGDDLAQETERLNVAKSKLKNITNEGERHASDIAEKQNRLKDVQAKLADLFKTMPPGTTVETLDQTINQYKTTIATNTKQVEDGAAAAKAKQDEVGKRREERDGIIRKIEERRRLFDRNSMTATIVAVNNDWGFVVIDAGENKKITPETKLLVTRGDQTLGKLNIVAVESSKTVANIDLKSLRNGLSIAPGDRVILETLVQ